LSKTEESEKPRRAVEFPRSERRWHVQRASGSRIAHKHKNAERRAARARPDNAPYHGLRVHHRLDLQIDRKRNGGGKSAQLPSRRYQITLALQVWTRRCNRQRAIPTQQDMAGAQTGRQSTTGKKQMSTPQGTSLSMRSIKTSASAMFAAAAGSLPAIGDNQR
jgi:hypothetical protein